MAEKEWDPFGVLGVDASMSAHERKAKYRALVEIFHPDRYGNSSAMVQAEAEERLKEINRAWADIQNGWTPSAGSADRTRTGGAQADERAAAAERRARDAEARAAAAERRAHEAETSAASHAPNQAPPQRAPKAKTTESQLSPPAGMRECSKETYATPLEWSTAYANVRSLVLKLGSRSRLSATLGGNMSITIESESQANGWFRCSAAKGVGRFTVDFETVPTPNGTEVIVTVWTPKSPPSGVGQGDSAKWSIFKGDGDALAIQLSQICQITTGVR